MAQGTLTAAGAGKRWYPDPSTGVADARTVIEQLPAWLTNYNEIHPHKALGYRSPRAYITQTRRSRQAFRVNDTHPFRVHRNTTR